jgi:putative FmdB family regulatory protein
MPIYAYRCRSCGGHFERHQSFTDVALRLCPDCRRKTLDRIISRVGIVFKGPGFYSTDNKPAAAHIEQKKRPHKEKTQPESASTPPEKTGQG